MNAKQLALLKRYNKDRDEAVASLNVEKFKAFCRRWGNPVPPSDKVVEITMRKMMYHITNFPEADRQSAKEWLESRGYSTEL